MKNVRIRIKFHAKSDRADFVTHGINISNEFSVFNFTKYEFTNLHSKYISNHPFLQKFRASDEEKSKYP